MKIQGSDYMNIRLLNMCNDVIIVNTYLSQPVTINPNQIAYVAVPDIQPITISIKCNKGSYVSKGKYTLSVETTYTFGNVSENEVFEITKEKIRIASEPVYYERAFLYATNALCLSEDYVISDCEKIKKAFNKARLKHFLLISPLEEIGLTLVLLIIGIFLTYKIGWKLAVIYFPCAYVFLLLLAFFSDHLFNLILKRTFKQDTEKAEFYKYFDNSFIKSYYSNPKRTPFFGEMEV